MQILSRLKLGTKINSLVIGILLTLGIIILIVVSHQVEEGVKEAAREKAKSDLNLGFAYIDQLYPGEWHIKDGELFKGTTRMNENFEVVDQIGELTGGDTVTIFQGNTRVATNVKKDGKRAVGTTVSGEVEETVLNQGKIYLGEANVVGFSYQTAYSPLKDKNGDIIGIWYVGASEGFITTIIQSITTSVISVIGVGILVSFGLIFWFINRLNKRLKALTTALEKAGEGDFTIEIEDSSEDEIGQLLLSYNRMKKNLSELIENVITTSEQVAASSEELTSSAEETSRATEQISNAIQEVATGTENQASNLSSSTNVVKIISNDVNDISSKIEDINIYSQKASKESDEGQLMINNVIEQMNVIKKNTEETGKVIDILKDKSLDIGKIINIITDISEQTNLLSLNAAIEAARAGEHGKGFAVVADEVRKLAEQSKQSASQIQTLIREIQEQTKKAVEYMDQGEITVQDGNQIVNKAGTSFSNISSSVNTIAKGMTEVKSFIVKINDGTNHLVSSIEEVNTISIQTSSHSQNVAASAEEQSASMEEITAASQTLAKMAENLQDSVKTFKI